MVLHRFIVGAHHSVAVYYVVAGKKPFFGILSHGEIIFSSTTTRSRWPVPVHSRMRDQTTSGSFAPSW